MKIVKKLTALLCAAAVSAAAIPAMPTMEAQAASTPQQILDKMGIGWNLGNSLDTNGTGDNSETFWGNPRVTKELIEFVHDQGFSSIRIPVTWGNHMDSSHNIDASYLKRVKEVVDYAYNDGMYVIINIHHDNEIKYDGKGNFFFPTNQYKAQSETFVKSVWQQVSETFKSYDEHLVFETLNEPRLIGDGNEWWFDINNPPSKITEAIGVINTLNQDAVDVIRASGGNNKTRLIMCPGYDASVDGALVSSYKLPNDSSNMVGVSIHAYSPYEFAMNASGPSQYTDSLKSELEWIFGEIKSKLIDKGMYCYIGEFGATNKNNESERCAWAEDYTSKAKALGIPVFVWDNNAHNVGGENFGIIKRDDLTVTFPNYLKSLTKAYPVSDEQEGMPVHTPGDANEDGKVNIADVIRIQQSLAGWKVKINAKNSDVNGDGKVNIADVIRIQQHLAGWKVTLK